ncbi:LLM class flavin-dependent oxidoreductase [Lederbergia wuyishanensis]|uniref:LLM family oxidoreductase n=1 Tax=Lederbergia wuyishanensis TaxID=1347903 RepID=A0ABU0D4E6_9BACI|nr:LLM class flavin-dependent oxidoreductase [Lederbergia wuyishanensis]MCJ8008155.1 LLM class flavin-dependent oxidoreductase [Lederbergia wuyishanensis]MDQ0343256.1 putative LLM family oxidoreductase [Lederbergia wuyishanensis]
MESKKNLKHSGFEIGLYTLADIVPSPLTGETISASQRIKEIIQAAKLADEGGLDIFGVGEHHRLDYAVSSPQVVLAAIAQATKRIKLTSATTVLSTVDPVRLFEDFATLDLISDGRAEIIAGRGAFLESFPLFGFDINDFDNLFKENIELLLKINENERISWSGRFRSQLKNAEIAPRPLQKKLPIWLGVGRTPKSADRAGRLGVGMAMVILDGESIWYKPLVDLYRKAATESGHQEQLNVSITGQGYLADTTQQAMEEFYPFYFNYWAYLNRQRGMTFKMKLEDLEKMTSPETALFVGSPQQIVEKILYQYELFGHRRFMVQMDIGGIPFENVARAIELLATEVAPVVRKKIST